MITGLLIFSIVLLAGVLVVNMLRPRFTRATVSSAMFFRNLPPSRETKSRLRLSNPARSRPMIFQALMLAALVAALFLHRASMRGMAGEGIALWILVDTSASMDAVSTPGVNRMDLALQEARRSIERAAEVAEGKPLHIRMSGFDLERTDLVDTRSTSAALAALEKLKARPLGTDLTIISAAATRAKGGGDATDNEAGVHFTHFHVISDQAPKPLPVKDIQLAWSNVGKPANNQGIFDIQPSRRDPITSLVREVTVTCEYFGEKAVAHLTVTGPSGEPVADTGLAWKLNRKANVSFPVEQAGLYRVVLKNKKDVPDSYRWDDRAAFRIGETRRVAVDWQLAEDELLRQINWKQDSKHPDIRVVPYTGTTDSSSVPTLYVETRPAAAGSGREPIQVFENHPLNHALDFDAFDELGIPSQPLPAGFKPVLAGPDGKSGWMAYRTKPGPAVYLPGVPSLSTNRLDVVSRILFVNSVRWLLGLNHQSRQPLYELTSPANPIPKGNVLALHPGEGDTSAANSASLGNFENFHRANLPATRIPVWPALLALCAFALVVERGFAAFGGARWR